MSWLPQVPLWILPDENGISQAFAADDRIDPFVGNSRHTVNYLQGLQEVIQ
jgi:hypothetical protein